MNINLTLIGQSLSFIFFVWFCMHYVWPPMITILRERQNLIAQGLKQAEQSKHELAQAQQKVQEELNEAQQQSAMLIEQANKHAKNIIEEAKNKAQEQAQKQKALALAEIDQERNRMRETLRQRLSELALAGAKKILQSEINMQTHSEALEKLSKEL